MNTSSTARLITILDYFGVLCLIGLFVEKDNEDVRFHTNQGLILLVLEIVVGIVTTVLGFLRFIPFIGWIFGLVSGVLWFICLLFAILGIVNAVQGQRRPLPVIGGLFTFIR